METLKSKYTEVMKINKILGKQSEKTGKGVLKVLAGYNAATGEQNAIMANVAAAGKMETTNRVRMSQSS